MGFFLEADFLEIIPEKIKKLESLNNLRKEIKKVDRMLGF